MQIILSSLISSENTINKEVENELIKDITLRRGVDISSPQLVLTLENPHQYTYCHIPVLERYYFIRDVDAVTKGTWRFNLECDVLESFKSYILNSNTRFMRKIKTGDYLNVPLDSSIRKNVDVYHSDSGFDGEQTMIMTTVGTRGN